MRSLQGWKPHTCSCHLVELHDPDDPAFVTHIAAVLKKCPAHDSLSDADLYGAISTNPDSESKRYSFTLGFLLSHPTLGLSKPGGLEFKDGVTFNWSFDAKRVLTVSISGAPLPGSAKKIVRDFCDSTFGPKKVKVL